ncbi:hypothetical protein SAMN04515667_1377 [Formosa sp. Hel1_31_208]|uniref:hypothetical protein n=1 Tax=Formosa sp. Hel1_31_208 TaxID=1798225 RepID=UPI00087CAB7A|nr:hypothetical protein [Formosa sp. Hel1_31_208]SDS08644.1 hypothetical protein SAMN04515667_1377 [Formosa sp. Hel1_31_208]
MNVFILPFGKVNILKSNIAEIIINDGVVIDASMVSAYRNLLRSHLNPPFSLLINKQHGYSYTFEAQTAMGDLNEDVDYRAVIVRSQSGEMATEIVMDINKQNNWKIKIFKEREEGLNWLLLQQNNKSAI